MNHLAIKQAREEHIVQPLLRSYDAAIWWDLQTLIITFL